MTYRPFTFNGTIFTKTTKTTKALKREAAIRFCNHYNARHRLDAVQLISMMLGFGLVVHGMFV